jgi:hypothetical protein
LSTTLSKIKFRHFFVDKTVASKEPSLLDFLE